MVPHTNKGERLKDRRRVRRRLVHIVCAVLCVVAVAGIFYVLWQPYVRVSNVVVSDGDSSIAALARAQMVGTVWRMLPRDSYFMVPEQAIRNEILLTHPELEAVSITHPTISTLSIVVTNRVPLARWCGSTVLPQATVQATCYVFDATGFIYTEDATSTQPLSNVLVYTPLAGGDTAPIGQSIPRAAQLPAAFQFARDLAKFGSTAQSIALRGDEVDVYLASGTRITYVLGDEEGAYTLATSALPQMNLKDGSIEYVDLRFSASGRVYLKRKP